MFLVLIFTLGLSRTQGNGAVGRNMALKNPVTPSGNMDKVMFIIVPTYAQI
jgi:hypothetical protein